MLTDADLTFALMRSGHDVGIVSELGHAERHWRYLPQPDERFGAAWTSKGRHGGFGRNGSITVLGRPGRTLEIAASDTAASRTAACRHPYVTQR